MKKIKITRRTFCLRESTETLLDKLKEKTELNYSILIKEAIELLAEKKGIV